MTWMRSNALAVLAIVIALSSGAYAVTKAPKDSVVSKSIKNGAVKSKDLAAGAVDGSKVKDGSLTGADVDESTLVLPSEDKVDQVTLRLPANTPTAARTSHNGLIVKAGCLGASGDIAISLEQGPGVGVHHFPGEGTFEHEGPGSWDLAVGVPNGAAAGSYLYRRASDGAGVTLDYLWDNDSASPGSLVNSDCVISLTMTYTQS